MKNTCNYVINKHLWVVVEHMVQLLKREFYRNWFFSLKSAFCLLTFLFSVDWRKNVVVMWYFVLHAIKCFPLYAAVKPAGSVFKNFWFN